MATLPVELLISSGRGPYAWLIKKLTQSESTHAAMRFGDYFLLHANAHGVNLKTWKKFKAESLLLGHFRIRDSAIPTHIQEDAARDILETEGDGYDWLGILGFAYCLLMELIFKKDVKNPWNQRSSYWCSELVAAFWNRCCDRWHEAGGVMFDKIDPDKVAPSDLLEMFKKNSHIFEEILDTL